MARGKRVNTNRKTNCKRTKKRTGASKLDEMIAEVNGKPEPKKESKLKKAAKIGLGIAGAAAAAGLGYELYNRKKLKDMEKAALEKRIKNKDNMNHLKVGVRNAINNGKAAIDNVLNNAMKKGASVFKRFLHKEPITEMNKWEGDNDPNSTDIVEWTGEPKPQPGMMSKLYNMGRSLFNRRDSDSSDVPDGGDPEINYQIDNIKEQITNNPFIVNEFDLQHLISDIGEQIKNKDEFKYSQFKEIQDKVNHYCNNWANLMDMARAGGVIDNEIRDILESLDNARYQYNKIMEQ